MVWANTSMKSLDRVHEGWVNWWIQIDAEGGQTTGTWGIIGTMAR